MDSKETVNGVLGDTNKQVTITDLSQLAGSLLPRSEEQLTESLGEVVKCLEGLTSVAQSQTDIVGANTEAVQQNTVAQSSGGTRSTASTIGKIASSFLGSGLGLLPAVSAITKLFSGGKEEEQPLVTYTAPPALQIEAPITPGTALGSPWASFSTATAKYDQTEATTVAPKGEERLPSNSPQITIQVQAMDSRSFMDHSGEIAKAVREAMLNMHTINDVVNDL